jgi:hypothetical protein
MVATLKASGVRRVYGIPGDSLNGFTDALRRDGEITWEHVRHEEAAGFAAAAEAALTGELAVCAGSCGPGNLHLINGLYDANRSRVPVLAIAAHIPEVEIGLQVGKRLVEGFTQRELPDRWAGPVSTVMHWSYGSGWGALYGILAGSLRRPNPLYGLPFGAVIWVSDYVLLPEAGLYKPIWDYDAKTLAGDLTAHLAYGAGTGTTFWLITRIWR